MTESATSAKPAGREPPPYALGYSEAEFRRLTFQGELFRDLTGDMLRRAGIEPGMRVLDVGCGVGDVSLLAAQMVGPAGTVLGVDRAAEAVEVAKWRAMSAGLAHARFGVGELDAFSTPQRFDAAIGRFVLLYLPDRGATLRRLATLLRPGGIVAFQEFSIPLIRSIPEGPLFRRCCNWVIDTFTRAGFEPDMGGKLHATFLAAGLPAPQMIAAGRVEAGAQSPVYDYMAGTLRSLLPVMEKLGIARAAEVDVETIADRLRQEALAQNACVMLPPLVGAWTRVPG